MGRNSAMAKHARRPSRRSKHPADNTQPEALPLTTPPGTAVPAVTSLARTFGSALDAEPRPPLNSSRGGGGTRGETPVGVESRRDLDERFPSGKRR